jgi:ABC-type multidrug transport system permease subunit
VLAAAAGTGLRIYDIRDVAAVLALSVALAVVFFGISTVLAILVRDGQALFWLQGALIGAAVLIGDTVLPFSLLPGWLTAGSTINPVRYAVQGARAATAKAPNWQLYSHDLALLAALAILSYGAALLVFRFDTER